MKRHFLAAIALLALSLGAPANAAPIQYTVNQAFGPGNVGSVTGTITTDGTLGTLTAANFLSWNLELYDGIGTGEIISGLNGSVVVLLGSPVTATASLLTYNYNLGPVNILDIYDTVGDGDHLCYTSFSNCFGPPGVGTHNVSPGALVYSPQSGVQVIAFNGTQVPAPGALALLGLGLAGLGAIRRKHAA